MIENPTSFSLFSLISTDVLPKIAPSESVHEACALAEHAAHGGEGSLKIKLSLSNTAGFTAGVAIDTLKLSYLPIVPQLPQISDFLFSRRRENIRYCKISKPSVSLLREACAPATHYKEGAIVTLEYSRFRRRLETWN